MKIWNDEEVKSLFDEVENCKNSGKALREAFVIHAQKFNRKPNSVRNYYYHEVDNLNEDEKRCVRLNVNLASHEKTHFEGFNKEQAEELFEAIEKMVQDGVSVRSACQSLSGGDLSLMTRLQNKYQNMCRKVKKENNIIPFKVHQKTLTDNEINSLFMGLVRLIKKTAEDEVAQKNQTPNELLRKAFVDLGKKDKEIFELKSQFEQLKRENQKLRMRLEENKKSALEKHILDKRGRCKEEESKRV